MRRQTKAAILFIGVVITLIAWTPVTRALAWRRDYTQAEQLSLIIWPMATEIKRFSEVRGRSPANLDELAEFSPNLDYSAVQHFPHTFNTTGPRRLFLRVNERFAFVVDEHFTPDWWQPTRILSAPTNPQ